ncbi:MAG: hypothetical protein IJS51_03350 [Treponema sp.]|nr:hypothetical protein [Treponema sp.]
MTLKIKSKLFSFLKLAGFIAACAAASFIVIAPLWFFATKTPGLYSAAVLIAATIFAALKVAARAKKAGAKKSLFFAAKVLTVAAGFFGAALSLMNWQRILFLASVAAAVVLYQVVCRIEKRSSGRR